MNGRQDILNKKLAGARAAGKKLLAVLIDPDKTDAGLPSFVRYATEQGADVFLVGGSLLVKDELESCVSTVKQNTERPVYLFPSGPAQISAEADGILFLSLISGRNADLLIGKQVEAAPLLAQTDLDVVSTGYMLIDCGNVTTAHYMSQSSPIPYHKPDIAAATAMAGSYLGLSTIYMDGGSGAAKCVSADMISAVARNVRAPLIVGGGIRSAEDASIICEAGADMVVVGNALERQPDLLQDISIAVHAVNVSD